MSPVPVRRATMAADDRSDTAILFIFSLIR
jgi:hypothetical protein